MLQPVKSLFPLTVWLLRLAVLVLVYMIFFVTLRNPVWSSDDFYVACGFVVFAILLFLGGFLKSHGMTMISAILLFVGCLYEIVMHYAFSKGRFVAIYAVFSAVSFFFIANGNRKK